MQVQPFKETTQKKHFRKKIIAVVITLIIRLLIRYLHSRKELVQQPEQAAFERDVQVSTSAFAAHDLNTDSSKWIGCD